MLLHRVLESLSFFLSLSHTRAHTHTHTHEQQRKESWNEPVCLRITCVNTQNHHEAITRFGDIMHHHRLIKPSPLPMPGASRAPSSLYSPSFNVPKIDHSFPIAELTLDVPVSMAGFFFRFFFFFFCFLGPHPWHMGVPRLGVESELEVPA